MHELRRRDLPADIGERLWSRVKHSKTGCWPWMGPAADGRGKLYLRGGGGDTVRSTTPRRVAFVLGVRDLESGEAVDVVCGNSRCCRPDHLKPRRGPDSKSQGTSLMTRAKIRLLYKQGLKVTAIADQLGMHPGTVSRILRRKA